MILRGILANSLNGQLCLRGFAPIKKLADISQADYSYQRDPKERDDILDFLEKQSYLFFPEIILSYKIPYKIDEKKEEPLKLIQQGKGYSSNFDKTKITQKIIPFKDSADISGKSEVVVLSIELNDEDVITQKPFHRIDGNHRLIAAEKSSDPKVERMEAPFCIILGTDYFNGNMKYETEDSKSFDKATKVFFHNINTKTIPLTSEENLKVLIDDEKTFPNDELRDIFGGDYPLKTRELIDLAKPQIFQGIGHILEKQYRSYYNDIFYYLLEEGISEDDIVNKVLNALQVINTLYTENKNFKNNDSFGILTALLFYKIKNNGEQFETFKNWIIANNILEITEITAESLITIFEKIIAKEIKVFVAMPYFDGNEEIIKDYNKIYKETIDKIKDEHKINISLYPIMSNKGATQDQIQDIINKIRECSIFFADITDNNANVSYEMGWARALNKKVIIVRRKNSEKPKSDYINDTYHEYDDSSRSVSLGKIIKENILEELEKSYGLIKD